MNTSKKIVKESVLLTELVHGREKDIEKAVNKVLRVRMTYNDKKGGKGKNERYILPVAFGLTKSGKKAIRAYETAGSTKRGLTRDAAHPKGNPWKMFLYDNIISWSNGQKTFKQYANTLISRGLNTHGDKGMTILYAITPIADKNIQVAKDSEPISPLPLAKTDVSPTNQVQNPQTTNTEKFISAQDKRDASIDNTSNKSYIQNKLEAPSTQPVTKQQVSNRYDLSGLNGRFIKSPYNFASSEPQFDINSDEWNKEYEKAAKLTADNEPITKHEINPDNELTAKYNDMMSRMDKLYNDEEEKED